MIFVCRQKAGKKQLCVLLGYGIHAETISISTESLGLTLRENISTKNSIAIFNHLSLDTSIFFIKATETYICLHVSFCPLERPRKFVDVPFE